MPQPSPVDVARSLAGQLAARADAADEGGALPPEDIEALHQSGYLKLALPQAWGGRGCTLPEMAEAQVHLAAGSASTALVAAMTVMLVGYARGAEAWAQERERLLELIAAGGLVNAIASEPELGSPSRGGLPLTSLERQDDHFLLNGHKTWATGGRHLSHMLVLARLDDGTVQLLLPNHAPGMRWEETWGKGLSLRASDSHDLRFEDVRVEPGQLLRLGRSPADHKPNPWFVGLVAATYLGAARASRDAVADHCLHRVPSALGKPIAELPSVRRQLGEMQVAYLGAEAALLRAAEAWEANSDPLPLTAAKHLVVETALQVTEGAMRIAGGSGLSQALPLARHFRDVRAGFGHPPSGDASLERLGAALLERRV